jgi:hypothetical protein
MSSRTCPFESGKQYLVLKDIEFLNHRFIRGSTVSFQTDAYDAHQGVTRYWFKNVDSDETNIWHVFDDDPDLSETWQQFFKPLMFTAVGEGNVMKRTARHVFAVVRVDAFQSSDSPWQNRITVKEVVQTEQEARTEVERLNTLNKAKGAVYFWQITRLVEGGKREAQP